MTCGVASLAVPQTWPIAYQAELKTWSTLSGVDLVALVTALVVSIDGKKALFELASCI